MINIKKTLYLATGLLSLALGIAGIFLPLLPTTCFILLSAFCFSKSSERLYHYLLEHPLFGRQIKAWQQHGVIPLKIKIIATSMMLVSVSYPLLIMEFNYVLKLVTAAAILLALLFIWSRPGTGRRPEIRYHADFEMLRDSSPPAA